MKIGFIIQDLQKLLGIAFDNQLNFNHHFSKFCKTTSNNLHASLEFPITSMKIEGEYFLIHTFYFLFIYFLYFFL